MVHFLCNCRLRNPEYKIAEYEIIEGKVADDDGADAFAEFEQGNISKDEAIEWLLEIDFGTQICLRTNRVINSYLTFMHSEPV